mmetsp:Transcript_83669/g.167583  ORF Transcript_83669/g.167583 Transcript_83669/m.167583 type:complete len:146 (-) Transcript_83669:57-494(-)
MASQPTRRAKERELKNVRCHIAPATPKNWPWKVHGDDQSVQKGDVIGHEIKWSPFLAILYFFVRGLQLLKERLPCFRSNIKGANPKTGPNSESHPKLEAEERQTLRSFHRNASTFLWQREAQAANEVKNDCPEEKEAEDSGSNSP